jgi:Rho termination factor, N-terminal domain
MSTRITVDQLERMKVHELADLLANVVLLLKRMPNVECRELLQSVSDDVHFSQAHNPESASPAKIWDGEELRKKTVADLKKIADELHISYSTKSKKDELVAKILARSASGRSEQYAIQEI